MEIPQNTISLIKVYSFPRSGTNFLMKSLQSNFFPNIDLSSSGQSGHWTNRQFIKNEYGQLFGSHTNYIPPVSQKSIYIYRDVRDVVLSIWKSYNFINPKDHKNLTFKQFIHYKLDWVNTPGQKSLPTLNSIEQWNKHTQHWEVNKHENILFIRYEDLVLNFSETLDTIRKFAKLSSAQYSKPELVGLSPNKGKVQEWKNYFDDDDLKYLNTIINPNNKFLYTSDVI